MAGCERIAILIPAAGDSVRFKEAGWSTPKPLLMIDHPEIGRAHMLSHVLAATRRGHAELHDAPAVVALPAGCGGKWSAPRTICMELQRTRGQADTLMQMICATPLSSGTGIIVVNCDIVHTAGIDSVVRALLRGYSMSFLVHQSASLAMSYIDRYPVPNHFAEKERISSWAMSGVWGFSSPSELLRALESVVADPNREPYLSHAMNLMRGSRIAIECGLHTQIDLGTPEAVREAGARII